MASEVVGVRIPDATFDRLRGARSEAAEALAITVETAEWLRDHVSGLQVTSWHGSPGTAERLLGALSTRSGVRVQEKPHV